MVKRIQRRYSMAERREVLDWLLESSRAEVSAETGIPLSTMRVWIGKEERIRNHTGNQKAPTMGGQGPKELFPFSRDLLLYMKEVRREEKILSSIGMIEFMKQSHSEWLDDYISTKHDEVGAYSALMRLCQRFAHRHGFSRRTPTYTKELSDELAMTKLAFSIDFWEKHGATDLATIYNADETSVYLDTPPNRIWAEVGGSAKVTVAQKHSARLTALLTIRADGKKLPILFIVKGKPGGSIESQELPTYPSGHHYVVQENAWMDKRVWKKYVKHLLRWDIQEPSVILLDNFDAHVSEEGKALVAEKAGSTVYPLPANATSVCQPLDVGVMGPFKSILRALWLKEPHTAQDAATKRMVTIKRAIKAWELITTETVISSFIKAIPREQYAEV